MINLQQYKKGFVLLLTLVVIMLVSGIAVLIIANKTSVSAKKTGFNIQVQQAQLAAEAGMESAIIKMNTDSSLIYPYTQSSTALNNSATYTYTISRDNGPPIIYTIQATGRSQDELATRVLTQNIASIMSDKYDLNLNLPAPIIAKSSISLSGNANVNNTQAGGGSISVLAGGIVSLSGNANTSSTEGSSDKNSIGDDIVDSDHDTNGNSTLIQNMTNDEFFEYFMGDTKTNVSNSATTIYSNTGDTNYSSRLDGVTGEIVWIDETSASIQSNAVIGSEANPVVLIFTGSVEIRGGANIYGVVYAMGTVDMGSGGAVINGTLITEGSSGLAGTLDSTGAEINSLSVDTNSDNIDSFVIVQGGVSDF